MSTPGLPQSELLRPSFSLQPVCAPSPAVHAGPAFGVSLYKSGAGENPEATMRDLVIVTETELMAHDDSQHSHPGRLGGEALGGFCRSAAHVLEYYAKRDHHQAATYQIRDIHELFNNGAADPRRIREAAFGHAAAAVKIRTALFLGELTFGQFCTGNTVRQSATQDTGIPSTDPLAQQLIRDCYVPLTDETLRAYLRLTTGASPEETGYIETATVDRLLTEATPLAFYFSDEEIASGAMWHRVPCTEQSFPCTRPAQAMARG